MRWPSVATVNLDHAPALQSWLSLLSLASRRIKIHKSVYYLFELEMIYKSHDTTISSTLKDELKEQAGKMNSGRAPSKYLKRGAGMSRGA